MIAKTKAFTLIELLVVVAIIGILAAVGVVAYNGYTGAAKREGTKSNHSQVIKLIQNTFGLCLTNETVFLVKKGGINCADPPSTFTAHFESYLGCSGRNYYPSSCLGIKNIYNGKYNMGEFLSEAYKNRNIPGETLMYPTSKSIIVQTTFLNSDGNNEILTQEVFKN